MRKNVKKRTAAASGFIKILDDVAYYKFNRRVLAKIGILAKLSAAPEDEDVRMEFQVPRHVINYIELDDTDSYDHMLANAKKCKDPAVNLAIELLNVGFRVHISRTKALTRHRWTTTRNSRLKRRLRINPSRRGRKKAR